MTANIIRNMPEADYHAHKALSATGAWTLANDCPALYWYDSPFNADAGPDENGKAMDIGTALHLAALEPGRLLEKTVPVDAEDWRTKAAKEARDAAYGAGLVPLLHKDMALVDRLTRALWENRYVADLLDGAETELSYFWDADGVPCKARADIVTRDGAAMGDLKASASASPLFFQRQAFNAGHFLRSPWYQDGWRIADGRTIEAYWYIIVSREPPHLVSIARLDDRAMEWGRMTIRRALALFKQCRAADEWPGYCDVPTALSLPGWAEYQLADREQDGWFDPAKISDAAVRRGVEFLAP